MVHLINHRNQRKINGKKAMNEQERNERQLKYGRNVLENGIKVPEWKKFLSYFHDARMYILLGAAIVKLLQAHILKAV